MASGGVGKCEMQGEREPTWGVVEYVSSLEGALDQPVGAEEAANVLVILYKLLNVLFSGELVNVMSGWNGICWRCSQQCKGGTALISRIVYGHRQSGEAASR